MRRSGLAQCQRRNRDSSSRGTGAPRRSIQACERKRRGQLRRMIMNAGPAASFHSRRQYGERRRDKLTRRANHFRFAEIVSSPKIKNISLFPKGETVAYLSPARPAQRGVGQRHDVGRVAVDAEVSLDERHVTRTAKTCGPDASVLASSWRSVPPMMVARKPITRESTL